jgi:hypothetical protein
MKTLCHSLILSLFVSLFMSCEKDTPKISFSYLDESGFVKNGLIGYYPFNGDVKDYSGNAHDAIGSNLTFTTDRYNYANGAIHFDGVNDFLRIPNWSKSLEKDECTLVAWCKNDTSYTKSYELKSAIISMVDSTHTCFLLSTMGNYYWCAYGNFPKLGGGTMSSDFKKEGFQVFVFSFTDSSITIYDQCYSSFSKTTIRNQKHVFDFFGNRKEQDLYLGKSVINAFDSEPFKNFFTWFKGDIDDLLIYNRILTHDEVMYFFNEAKQ